MVYKRKGITLGEIPRTHVFLYEKIRDGIRDDILCGRYSSGDKLPSLDEFTRKTGANRLTVRKALKLLCSEGFLYSVPARGIFVSRRLPASSGAAPADGVRQDGLKVVGLMSQYLRPLDYGQYHREVVSGINGELGRHGVNLLLVGGSGSGSEDALSLVSDAGAEAMIYMGNFDADVLGRLVREGPPAVAVDCALRGLPCDSVCADNEFGASEVGRLIIESGCAGSFAVITGNGDASDKARMRGLESAFLFSGIDFFPRFTVPGGYSESGGRKAMSEILEADGELPAAVFCMNDEMAFGAIHVLESAGISVPGRVKVVGFDNIGMAGCMRPGLTTVEADAHLAGRTAVRMLMRRLESPDVQPSASVISTKLVRRESF